MLLTDGFYRYELRPWSLSDQTAPQLPSIFIWGLQFPISPLIQFLAKDIGTSVSRTAGFLRKLILPQMTRSYTLLGSGPRILDSFIALWRRSLTFASLSNIGTFFHTKSLLGLAPS